jgi:hypothetical protein
MLSGEPIICISSIDWDFLWQGHQEIMSRLAASGNLVLFVENTGVRAPTVRDLPRLRRRLRNWWKGTHGFREERDNLFVYSPLVLPFPYSPAARVVNRTLILTGHRAVGTRHGHLSADRLDVPPHATRARPRASARPDGDGVLLHR